MGDSGALHDPPRPSDDDRGRNEERDDERAEDVGAQGELGDCAQDGSREAARERDRGARAIDDAPTPVAGRRT